MAESPSEETQLLAEVDDVLRSMPDRSTLRHPTDQNFDWLARACVVMRDWDRERSAKFDLAATTFMRARAIESDAAFREMMVLLRQAHHDLSRNVMPMNLAIDRGGVFDYFDKLREIVSIATQDVLFIDPYLDAEFVSRYLPYVQTSAQIRLLTTESKLPSLKPSVDAFSQQHARPIHLRISAGLHDRYVIVDQATCYQSGASFKDGARSAPTVLTQITDPFPAVLETYEKLWLGARVER